MRKNSLSRGFTLLEVSIATFILTIGIGGSFILVQRVFTSSAALPSKLIATYLAQEGIEIVRNIRDTNWVKGVSWESWYNGITPGCFEIDYDDDYDYDIDLSSPMACSPCEYKDLRFLYLDNGFYQYSPSGEKTAFKRKICLTKDAENSNVLKVSVEVYWQEKGEPQGPVRAQANLYRWR